MLLLQRIQLHILVWCSSPSCYINTNGLPCYLFSIIIFCLQTSTNTMSPLSLYNIACSNSLQDRNLTLMHQSIVINIIIMTLEHFYMTLSDFSKSWYKLGMCVPFRWLDFFYKCSLLLSPAVTIFILAKIKHFCLTAGITLVQFIQGVGDEDATRILLY